MRNLAVVSKRERSWGSIRVRRENKINERFHTDMISGERGRCREKCFNRADCNLPDYHKQTNERPEGTVIKSAATCSSALKLHV